MSAVTPTITSAGNPIPATLQLVSIDIRTEVGRVPSAELRFLDGDSAEQKFPVSDGPVFAPGTPVEISLRYEEQGAKDAKLFSGVVVRQTVEASSGSSTLIVTLKDAAVKLTATRTSAVHAGKSDVDIIRQLVAKACPGSDIKGAGPIHAGLLQYDCTPWDFILLRAEAMGMLVVVELGKVKLVPMAQLPGAAKLTLSYGLDDILEIELVADAARPVAAVSAMGWDRKTHTLTPPAAAKPAPRPPGNLDPGALAASVGRESALLVHPVPPVAGELNAWADARAARASLSMVRGRIAVGGTGALNLLDGVQLEGMGDRFNGVAVISGIRHRHDDSGWRTDLELGLPPELPCEAPDVASVPAAGLQPPVRGLHVGIVAAFAPDPTNELRVKVIFPGADPAAGVWARLACPEAGLGRGYYFRPEINDEVIVGFLHDDPRHPVILGSLFGSRNAAPAVFGPPSADNAQKGIVTKTGAALRFIDAPSPAVHIQTPAGNSIVIDDAAGGITLSDKNGNKITLGPGGITIDAGAGNVTIKGAKVEVA